MPGPQHSKRELGTLEDMDNMKKKTKKIKWRRYLPLYLMALPGLGYLLINNYIPMAGLVVAFKNFNYKDGIFGSPWCGWQNFTYLFSTSTSFVITRNTICYNRTEYGNRGDGSNSSE